MIKIKSCFEVDDWAKILKIDDIIILNFHGVEFTSKKGLDVVKLEVYTKMIRTANLKVKTPFKSLDLHLFVTVGPSGAWKQRKL